MNKWWWKDDEMKMKWLWNDEDDHEMVMKWGWSADEMMMEWWWNDDELMMNWWWSDDELMMKWWWNDDEMKMKWWNICTMKWFDGRWKLTIYKLLPLSYFNPLLVHEWKVTLHFGVVTGGGSLTLSFCFLTLEAGLCLFCSPPELVSVPSVVCLSRVSRALGSVLRRRRSVGRWSTVWAGLLRPTLVDRCRGRPVRSPVCELCHTCKRFPLY